MFCGGAGEGRGGREGRWRRDRKGGGLEIMLQFCGSAREGEGREGRWRRDRKGGGLEIMLQFCSMFEFEVGK